MGTVDYDVIVVGGGPAGAAAALAAVEGGLNTLLIEKKKMPRLKPCAGYIFDEARGFLEDHYGALPGEVKAHPYRIKNIRLYTGKGRYFEVAEDGLSIWRDKFDRWLCEESGAEIWEDARLVDFGEWGDRVELVCARDGGKVKLSAGTMIAADGALSMVTARIDPTFAHGVPYIATRHEYHRCDTELEPGIFHVFVDAEYGVYPAVYFKDDLMVIDTSVRKGGKIGPARRAFHAMLEKNFGFDSREVAFTLGCRAIFPSAVNRFCLGTDRVLVVGEAAGFMNALGEGISSALATGYLAGKAAVKSAGAPPGHLYRESVKPERERTAREWSLPAIITGRARPELRQALIKLSPLDKLRVTRAILAWQRGGGVAPGIQRDSIEVMLRRLLHGSYDFRT